MAQWIDNSCVSLQLVDSGLSGCADAMCPSGSPAFARTGTAALGDVRSGGKLTGIGCQSPLNVLGWVSIGLAAAILPVAILDPALSGFALFGAPFLAGISAVGLHSRLRLAVSSILLSVVSALVLFHRSADDWHIPAASTLIELMSFLAVPLIMAFVLIAIGCVRRARGRAAESNLGP